MEPVCEWMSPYLSVQGMNMQLSVCSDNVVQQAKEDALLYETVQ